jgi:hypothetical protein
VFFHEIKKEYDLLPGMFKLGLGLLIVCIGVMGLWLGSQEKSVDSQTADSTVVAKKQSVSKSPGLKFATGEMARPVQSLETFEKTETSSSFLNNLAREVRAIDAETNPLERANKIESFIKGVAFTSLPAVVGFLERNQPAELSQALAAQFIREWAQGNPSAAADSAEKMPLGPARTAALNNVATVWANTNLDGAIKWVEQLSDPGAKQSGLTCIAYEAARVDPVQAMNLAVELPACRERNDLISHTAAQWAAVDPQAAVSWVRRIPDAELRLQVLGRVAIEWADQDPAAAASLAATELSDACTQDNAVVSIVERWAEKDPKGALAWVQQFPTGILRQVALDNIAKLSGISIPAQ